MVTTLRRHHDSRRPAQVCSGESRAGMMCVMCSACGHGVTQTCGAAQNIAAVRAARGANPVRSQHWCAFGPPLQQRCAHARAQRFSQTLIKAGRLL